MFYQILINELVLYKKQQDQENKIVKNLDYTSLVPNVMIRDELIINCEVDVRQGDPGTSRFFLSLDDNLLRLLVDQKFKISCRLKFQMTHH
jgi:hypothetical protein